MEINGKPLKYIEDGGTWKDQAVVMPKIETIEPETQESVISEQIGLEADSEPEVSSDYQSAWIRNSESDNDDNEDGEGCVDGEVEEPPSKRPCYQFETDPTARKRQCNKLLRRLKVILDEFSTRIGQQVAVIVAQPPTTSVRTIKTFGSDPLQRVITRYHPTIIQDLSEALASQEPKKTVDPSRFELPHLIMEGKSVPVEKMTQAQLREFIPIMLRYSTGRGKPGWGKECMRPPWWPEDIPWSNIRLDSRGWQSKTVESWSSTLRRIIIACYKYHGREDLLDEAAIECGMPRSTLLQEDSSEVEHKVSPETLSLANQGPLEKVVHEDGTISLYVPKPADTRHVILTGADGHEYCVEISVPNSATSAVLGNFQMAPTEAHIQQMGVSQGQFVSLNN
ncbi:hypothetical protein GE061_003255 [Apolygus lucorum]|uniref:Nuclear respiratory factor 1 NLS/DNA-binding dimerisation domain-containing protein n=1 Tax=Apolygus lucorum TaxID=248454 RepID=A0A6A4JT91_APOLU|nr:hypothetical protein GE061_003255 [Apolygus lucorum]